MSRPQRVALIGLDCATPELLFGRFAADMPTLTALRRRALWGPLRSVIPPITVPAWSCMASGRTPGELGVYGFRNRVGYGYDRLSLATSRMIKVPRLWDLVSAGGGESVVVGVPGTYPPSPIRGQMVSCFMAPDTSVAFTSPPGLRDEIERVTGGYVLDVADFRDAGPDATARRIFDMTEQRFRLARHLATRAPWNLFAFVDMGPDRLHHRFWRYCEPTHPRHEADSRFAWLFRDYYRALDRHLADFLQVLPDDCAVLIVSDHGAQSMLGGFCLNQWLIERGLLVLSEPQPARPTPLDLGKVDWSRTVAWGEGGYYGRVFINTADREPEGIVPPHRYEAVRQELASALEAITDNNSQPMGSRAMRPEDVYPETRNIPPDLIVYFGDLRWRSIGSIGHPGLYICGNDLGVDDANHAEFGVFLLVADGVSAGRSDDLSLYDVAPTAQALLGLPAPPGQRGRALR
jgi:predicted AlkP superfamily phosphohydrolase/phosphomutase